MIVSGGWDNCVVIYDVRQKGPANVIFGPHVVGDSLDFYNEDVLLAGSFDQENPLSLWNLKTMTKMEDISWTGEEELMFSSHESPKINAAQFITHNKPSDILYLMAGGDTDEF